MIHCFKIKFHWFTFYVQEYVKNIYNLIPFTNSAIQTTSGYWFSSGQCWCGERYAQPALLSLTKATSNILVLLLQVLFFADKKMEIEVRRTKRTKTCYGFYQEKATKGFSLVDSWFYSKSLGRTRITSEIKLTKVARPLLHENLVKKDYHIIAGLKMEPTHRLY